MRYFGFLRDYAWLSLNRLSRKVIHEEFFPLSCSHGRLAYACLNHSAVGTKKRLVVYKERSARARTVRARRRRSEVIRVGTNVVVCCKDRLEFGPDGGVLFFIFVTAFEVVLINTR